MKLLATILLSLFTSLAIAQVTPEYRKAVDIGLGELQKGQCAPCLEAYDQAFAISKHSPLSHLRAARCAQLCQNEAKAVQLADKAVEISAVILLRLFDEANTEYPELGPFFQSELGKKTMEKAHAEVKKSGSNYELAKTLKTLQEDDQRPRQQIDEIESKYARESPEYQAFMRSWMENDSICLVKAEAIIAQYGYPGKSMVGEYESVIWLVIQHAPLEKQEKYLPLLDEAANKGELSKGSFALLVDRIRMYKGQPQIYGSQVVKDEKTGNLKFHTIEDEANVNKRRAEVGLGPLEEYARHFGFEWKQ
jgi:hypothetical protein